MTVLVHSIVVYYQSESQHQTRRSLNGLKNVLELYFDETVTVEAGMNYQKGIKPAPLDKKDSQGQSLHPESCIYFSPHVVFLVTKMPQTSSVQRAAPILYAHMIAEDVKTRLGRCAKRDTGWEPDRLLNAALFQG